MSLTGPVSRIERSGVEYAVRMYEPGDRAGFLGSYEQLLGQRLGTEWFDATYVDIPHLDHVPMVVVESAGAVVGACPFSPVLLRGGRHGEAETALALFNRDVFVAPDHRRRGLYTAAIEYAVAHYAASDAACVISPSVPASRRANERLGWAYGPPRRTHYRTRDATAFVAHRLGPEKRFAAPLPGVTTDAYVALRDRLRHDSGRVDVTRRGGLAVASLADLHGRQSGRPEHVSPVFDAEGLRYLLESPEFTPLTTYVARDGDDIVAAVVVHPRWYHGTHWLSVVHVAPLAGDERWERALSTLLGRVIDDHNDVDAYRVAIPLPESVLASYGFLSDRHPPMSLLEPSYTRFGARPLGAHRWTLGGESLVGAPHLWSLVW